MSEKTKPLNKKKWFIGLTIWLFGLGMLFAFSRNIMITASAMVICAGLTWMMEADAK